MKKIWMKTATWIFLLLFFVGCSTKVAVPELEPIMYCEVCFSKNSVEYHALLERSLAGFCRFQLSSPDSVKDMTVIMENDVVTYNFQGLTHSLEKDADASLFSQTAEILDILIRGEGVTWESTKEQFTGRGEQMETPFRAVCDKGNRLISITTEDGLQVDFAYTT